MKRVRALLAGTLEVCAGVILLVLIHEVVLRFLPVAWAPAVQVPTTDNPIQRYEANRSFTWSLGWNFYVVVHGRTNAQGFVANQDYQFTDSKPVLAVVGDSMVESLMVNYAETLTGRLQTMLGDKGHAISIAQSGSPLSQYIAYAAHACTTYHPQRMVVVVVNNDFDESIYANRLRNGVHHLYPRADGGFDYKLTPVPPLGILERIARNSALALYLVRNVRINHVLANMEASLMRFSPARAETVDTYVGGGTSAAALPARVEEGYKMIAWFLGELPKSACLSPAQIVIVVDAIRPHLYDDEQLAAARSSYFGLMRVELLSKAIAKGFVVIDAEVPMQEDYKVSRRAFEFPTDSHWNSHAHSVMAKAVRQALGSWP